MSICVLGDRDDYDTFDLGAEWLEARRAAVPDGLLATVDELTLGGGKVAAHLLGIVLDTPRAADVRRRSSSSSRRPSR